MEKSIIELVAIAGKIAIEQTELHPIAKYAINWSIDRVTEHLKNEASLDIAKIRKAAKNFNIEKVIAVPMVSLPGRELIVIRAYGKRNDEFIKHLGLQLITEGDNKNFVKDVLEKENDFGILIYEK